MTKVLVVDDSALVRKLLSGIFAGQDDFEVAVARNGLEALSKIESFAPDVITLDVNMPEMDGLSCLDQIMLDHPRPVVMVSSLTQADAETTLRALRLGAVDFIAKPGGAVSLGIDDWAPGLVAKVRAAAGVKIRSTLRLKERVSRRIGRNTARIATGRGNVRAAAVGDGVVLIGISTGGPPALETLLGELPATFPWPIVIAQHMPASFTAALARRLDGLCAIGVLEVSGPTLLKPGVAYIGRGDADVVLARRAAGVIAQSVPGTPGYPWRPSTNRLVRSAMDVLPASQLIGVLMTGMGDDGAAAMTAMRAQGGQTIAEAEETAVVWGMPGELVKAGGADWVTPLPSIADKLISLAP